MTLLAPWALWFLTLIPVIVLLYLLTLKRRPVQISTLMFWQRVLQVNKRRALSQRLRQWLSLLLHLLIFLLILSALAKPEFDRFVKAGASTVLILDARARMQAVGKGGQSRFAKAKKLLAAYTGRAGGQNQMTLLAAHGTTEVVVPFSGNEKAFQQAVAELESTDAPGDLEGAIHLAGELLASRSGAKCIVIFTDYAPENGSHPLPVEFVPVGSSQDNLAITRFATRALLASPQTSEILLEVRNFSAKPADANVELYFDGNLIDVKPFHLQGNERKTSVFPSIPNVSASSRGWLTARLDTKDVLPCDNEVYAVLPKRQPAHVLLVTKGNWFIEKMLAADDLLKFDLLTPDAFKPGMAKNFDAVILDNFMPDGFDIRNVEGNFLLINNTPFVSGTASLDQPLITDVDESSPLMRLVNLKNVTFLRSRTIEFHESLGTWNFHAPLRSFEHPLVVAGTRKTGDTEQRMAAFAFDIADSDLPLRVAFPLLMSNTLEWLAGEKSDATPAFQAGEVIDLQPGQAIWKKPQTNLTALPKSEPAQMTQGSYRPLKNGFYLVKDGSASRWIAVNTFSEIESNLQHNGNGGISSENPRQHAPSLATFTVRPLWNYLALAAFFLFSLEWWLYHRRRTE